MRLIVAFFYSTFVVFVMHALEVLDTKDLKSGLLLVFLSHLLMEMSRLWHKSAQELGPGKPGEH